VYRLISRDMRSAYHVVPTVLFADLVYNVLPSMCILSISK